MTKLQSNEKSENLCPKFSLLASRFNHGFTLVEILVGLSIMALLFVGGYTAYREFQRRQVVASVATELKTNLSLVRQRALSGEKGLDCVGKTFVGYQFGITDSTHYYYRPSCPDQAIYSNSTTTITLPQGVAISGTNLPVVFKTIGQGTDLANDAVITITLTSDATSTPKTVTIKKGGAIE